MRTLEHNLVVALIVSCIFATSLYPAWMAELKAQSYGLGVLGAQSRIAQSMEEQDRLLKKFKELQKFFEPGRWGVFTEGSVIRADGKKGNDIPGFDSKGLSFLVGAEYIITESLVTGASLGAQHNATQFDDNMGSLDTNRYSISGYMGHIGDLYIGGIFTYSYLKFDQERIDLEPSSDLNTIDEAATANFNGGQILLTLETEYRLPIEEYDFFPVSIKKYNFFPRAGVSYARTNIDSYKETGSVSFARSVAEQHVDSLITNFGIRGQRSFYFADSWGIFTPFAQISFFYEALNNQRKIQTSLTSNSSDRDFLKTNSPDRFFNEVKVGANFMSWQGAQLNLFYSRLFSNKFVKSWQITGGLRIPF